MLSGLQGFVLRFEFHQHRLSGFGAVGVEICPFPLSWPLAYTRACTAVQAVTVRPKDTEVLIGRRREKFVDKLITNDEYRDILCVFGGFFVLFQ